MRSLSVFLFALGLAVLPQLAHAQCVGDAVVDGVVNVQDLVEVITQWGPCEGCGGDVVADGVVNVQDLVAVITAWGPCPSTYPCPADMPEYYDPAPVHDETSVEWVANGTCAEMIAENGSGAPACTQEQTAEMLTDINWILANYDFTNAVFDAATGSLQTFRNTPNKLLCGTGEGMYADGFFDDIFECWHGDLDVNSSLVLTFDWNVNVYEAHNAYEAYVQETYPGGFCEISVLMGQTTGFHAEDQGDGWKYWTVRSTETCDFYGCRCDASMTLWSNGTDYFIDQVTNDSIFTMYQGSMCTDPRFFF